METPAATPADEHKAQTTEVVEEKTLPETSESAAESESTTVDPEKNDDAAATEKQAATDDNPDDTHGNDGAAKEPEPDVKDVLAALRLLMKSGQDIEALLAKDEAQHSVQDREVVARLQDLAREQRSLSRRIRSIACGDSMRADDGSQREGDATGTDNSDAGSRMDADADETADNDDQHSHDYQSNTSELEPPPPVYCTPEIEFVPWAEAAMVDLPRSDRVAIQIPISQPSTDAQKSRRELGQAADQAKDALDVELRKNDDKPRPVRRGGLPRGSPDAGPLEEMPERVRVCSDRLGVFLDYSMHDGSLNRNSDSVLIFLRPFKYLVEKNEDLRDELAEMRRIRAERFPEITGGEEEFNERWEAEPPEDNITQEAVNFETIAMNQLTALIKDFECLLRFYDGYIEPSWQVAEFDHAFFSDLWYVFAASSLIYIKDKKVPQKVWMVLQRTSGVREYPKRRRHFHDSIAQEHMYRPLVIDCMHLDYDGTRYVPVYRRVQIDHYEGSQALSLLPAMPLRVAEATGLVDRQALLARGREFVECTRPSHKMYMGRSQTVRPNGEPLQRHDMELSDNASRYSERIESEVMIDFERALQEVPGWRPGMEDTELYKSETDWQRGIDQDSVWDAKLSETVLGEVAEKCARWDKERRSPEEDDDLLLLPDRVFGFVFRTRKWAYLQIGRDNDGVERVRPKVCRPEPWNDLQLPDGHKRLVQSLIKSHVSDGKHRLHFDLVRSKGRGVTILLHGVPGVGKTSTAECAAEASGRPLLPITCGDLGSTPREVEKKLDQAFQLAQTWNCVLLLDEADIFLTQRSENDIARNALVSVFLRALEYYQGILFLTTNRVGVFDEAFKSRIHISLYYPSLEWEYAEKIWRTHLRKLQDSSLISVDEEDIMSYAKALFKTQSIKGSVIGPVWNGRQIRNAFQSVVALAAHGCKEGAMVRVEREHFERVSKVSNEFNHYIWSIKAQTDADKAERWGYRLDSYQADDGIHMGSPGMGGGGGMGMGMGMSGGGGSPGFGHRLTPGVAHNGMAFAGNGMQGGGGGGFGQQAAMNGGGGFAGAGMGGNSGMGMGQAGMFGAANPMAQQMQGGGGGGGFGMGTGQFGNLGVSGIPRAMAGGHSPSIGHAQLPGQMGGVPGQMGQGQMGQGQMGQGQMGQGQMGQGQMGGVQGQGQVQSPNQASQTQSPPPQQGQPGQPGQQGQQQQQGHGGFGGMGHQFGGNGLGMGMGQYALNNA